MRGGDGEPGWKCDATLAGHHCRAVYSVDWSRAGMLATGGGDDTIRVFKEGSDGWECEVTSTNSHDMDINCVSWNPKDSDLLASCSDDETVRLWSIE